jgi:hypothetical protein
MLDRYHQEQRKFSEVLGCMQQCLFALSPEKKAILVYCSVTNSLPTRKSSGTAFSLQPWPFPLLHPVGVRCKYDKSPDESNDAAQLLRTRQRTPGGTSNDGAGVVASSIVGSL